MESMIISDMLCTKDKDGAPIVTVQRSRYESDQSWNERAAQAVAFHKAMLNFYLSK